MFWCGDRKLCTTENISSLRAMAASLSYAKIVRNQKDENNTSVVNATGATNVDLENENSSGTLGADKKDQSFREGGNGKKVWNGLI